MIRQVLILVCDNCGEQAPTECRTRKEVKEAGVLIGWRMKKETLCPYCRTILEEKGC
jgi:hypothetical protein